MTDLTELVTPAPPEKLTASTIGGLPVVSVSEAIEFINMLVYGDPGVGKTTLMGSIAEVPELMPCLFFDIEGGVMSIRNKFPGIEVVRVKSWSDVQKVYDELWRGKTGFRSVVIDSLTEMQKFSMLNIMKEVVAKDSDRDSEVPSIREWGKNGEQIRRLVRAFRDMPINAFFTAFGAEETTDKGVVTKVKPSLSGKLSAEVAGFLDMVLYMYIKIVEGKPKRLLLTTQNGKHIVKDRSDMLPPVIEDPSMSSIHRLMFPTNQNQE